MRGKVFGFLFTEDICKSWYSSGMADRSGGLDGSLEIEADFPETSVSDKRI